MRQFLDRITRLSLHFRWITLAATVFLIGLGVYSYTNLNQELIPAIEFPQTFILAQNGGTTSDQMLHTYSIPIEEGTESIDGVVNVESSSQDGFALIIVRNEFGLPQSQIVEEIRNEINDIELPVRRLEPPNGVSAREMLNELRAEHLAWLYSYAQQENIGFAQQLNRDVWISFSPEALSGFPDEAFANLETDLRNELLAKRSQESIAAPTTPPLLPTTWTTGDPRFKTTEDIAEMASNRNLAAVFNELYEDGYLVGPLIKTDDLQLEDVQLLLSIEDKCHAFRIENNTPLSSDGSDPCSFLVDLTAEVVLALPEAWLPEGYLAHLSVRDRNTLAQVKLARELTGQSIEREISVELPDSWQAESPQLLTFSFSDIPLGVITVSSATLTEGELRNYVENDLVPRLKDLENIANVVVAGGETIPPYILNPELEAVGLESIATINETSPEEADNPESQTPNTPSDIPVLSSVWEQVASGFEVEELNSADDFFNVTITIPSSGDQLTGVEIINWMATYEFTTTIIANELPAEVLLWMGEYDPSIWGNISDETLQLLPPDVIAQLPTEVQARRTCTLEPLEAPSDPPTLPENWQSLAVVFGVEHLETASDLITLSFATCQNPSAFLNTVAGIPQGRLLIRTLSVDILEYLAEVEADFYDHLAVITVSDLAWSTLNELPDSVQVQLRPVYNPSLGANWQQVSNQPEIAATERQLLTVNDLGDDPAAMLSNIVAILHNGQAGTIGEACGNSTYCEFAVLLLNDLSSDVIEAIVDNDADFLTKLAQMDSGQVALTYLSQEALNSPAMSEFIMTLEDGELKTILSAIRSGERTTAADSVRSEQSQIPEPDLDAPVLPASWRPIGGFIGSKLERADDIINTQYLPDYESGADFINSLATDPQGRGQPLVRELPLEVWLYLGEKELNFWTNLSVSSLRLIDTSFTSELPQAVQDRIEAGSDPFEPDDLVTRTDANASLLINIFKKKDSNTVVAWDEVETVLDDIPDGVELYIPFEQSSYIEESLAGVQREGTTGAIMAVIVILIFMNLSIRSTLVISVSIPASVMTAFFLMQFIPSNMNEFLTPILEDVGRETTLGKILEVIIRLFPASYTLNLLTLSGLTVAIGRVVDDSIVVLENIYRNIQHGDEQKAAIVNATREVSIAILAATLTTMVVFLPLGLFGGVTGAFFLPFGLAVTYSLIGSYIVAITTVPVLAQFLISKESIPSEGLIEITENMGPLERIFKSIKNRFIGTIDKLSQVYGVAIRWVLHNRLLTIVIAFGVLFFGMYLLGQRPQQFLPNFGDPTLTISVNLPAETTDGQPVTIAYTDARVRQLETYLQDQNGVKTILTSVGGDSQSIEPTGNGSIVETRASIQVGMESQEAIDELLPTLRAEAEKIFGTDYVQVSGAQNTGFGGFALELSGPEGITLEDLAIYNDLVLDTLSEVDGLVNIESTLGGVGEDNTTYIRIDGIPAIRYTAELESQDTLGVTEIAIQEVDEAVQAFRQANNFTPEVTVGRGFESEEQTEGFQEIIISMGIATLIVYLILALTFNHIIHPITILVSLPLSIVGAAVALTISGRALGLSAMIGLLMLIGIVVTNAVVLIDRVQQNRREKGMTTYDALVEAGQTRLRPILMTAVTTMSGVLPLALGFAEGAIIASELGTVVLGGLISSTFLTLLAVPVVYSLFDSLIQFMKRPFTGKQKSVGNTIQ